MFTTWSVSPRRASASASVRIGTPSSPWGTRRTPPNLHVQRPQDFDQPAGNRAKTVNQGRSCRLSRKRRPHARLAVQPDPFAPLIVHAAGQFPGQSQDHRGEMLRAPLVEHARAIRQRGVPGAQSLTQLVPVVGSIARAGDLHPANPAAGQNDRRVRLPEQDVGLGGVRVLPLAARRNAGVLAFREAEPVPPDPGAQGPGRFRVESVVAPDVQGRRGPAPGV